MGVSVVILNWNGRELLRKCIPSVITAVRVYTGQVEIIVVDNASSDGSLDYLKANFAQIKIIALSKNLGFAAAMNIGIKEAKYPIVIGLNNDVMVDENFIAPLVSHFSPPLPPPTRGGESVLRNLPRRSLPLVGRDREGEVFAVAAKMLLWDKKTLNFGQAVGSFKYGIFRRDFLQPSSSANTLYACGGAFAVDRNKFLELGGFDQDMDVYWEDLDICYRAWKQGWRTIYEPRSLVYHKKHGTYEKKCGIKGIRLLSGENYFLFAIKNFHDKGFIVQQILFTPVLALASIFMGRPHFALGLLRSIKRLPVFLRKRKIERKKAIFSDRQVLRMSRESMLRFPLPLWEGEIKAFYPLPSPPHKGGGKRFLGEVGGGGDALSNGRISVLQIGKYYDPYVGGTELHLSALANGLKDKGGVSLNILASNARLKTEIIHNDGMQTVKLATLGRFWSVPLSLSMPFWIKKFDADILHFHLPNPLSIFSYLISRPKGVVVATYHSDIIRQRFFNFLFNPFLRTFLRKASVIIVSSDNLITSSPILKRFKDRCRVVPHGIDTMRFNLNDRIAKEARSIRTQYGAPLLLFVGRLVYYKGLKYLIAAMKNVEAKLMIAGRGPLEKKLKKQARRLGVMDKIIWLGEIKNEEVAPFYHACDIFVLPSDSQAESFGLVQLEAFACGKPVISTALPTGVPFVNINAKTGIIVPPKDVQVLADAINRLLGAPELIKVYGQNARLRVEKEFSKEKMAGSVLKIYDELMR